MKQISASLVEARRALAGSSMTDAALRSSSDSDLLAAIGAAADLVRVVEVIQARLASEAARRSRPELGHAGLASREGFVNAAALVRSLTRSSGRDAARSIRVGDLLGETDDVHTHQPGDESVFGEIAAAVREGRLGVDGADQVLRSLAPVVADVDPDLLRDATVILGFESGTRNVDDLAVMARGVRDTLDRVGIIDRERYLRRQRRLVRGRVIDGLRRVTLVLDPETDAIILGAIDHALSPRLGGPRFTRADDQARAIALVDDERTNEQLALDTLTELVRIGIDKDDGRILGQVKPALRVTVSLDDLLAGVDAAGVEHPDTDTGVAWLEGSPEPVSAATARRILCDRGALPVVVGGLGVPVDIGATRRLFSGPQRVALSIRDGGCRFGDCDRPASWCEAHHVDPFHPIDPGAAPGPTTLANGILLCRRHHLILHDNGWHIRRGLNPGDFDLIPPASIDPEGTPRPMRRKAPPWLKTG